MLCILELFSYSWRVFSLSILTCLCHVLLGTQSFFITAKLYYFLSLWIHNYDVRFPRTYKKLPVRLGASKEQRAENRPFDPHTSRELPTKQTLIRPSPFQSFVKSPGSSSSSSRPKSVSIIIFSGWIFVWDISVYFVDGNMGGFRWIWWWMGGGIRGWGYRSGVTVNGFTDGFFSFRINIKDG